jgi:hypothetical protein
VLGAGSASRTFNVLGFTFICERTSQGKFFILRKTRRDRMRVKLKAVKEELRRRMHEPIPQQGAWLTQVVRGFFAYHAVPTNWEALKAFRYHVERIWLRTLRRRSQKHRMTWDRMRKLADDWLPAPRILHPWPDQRFAATTQGGSRNSARADLRARSAMTVPEASLTSSAQTIGATQHSRGPRSPLLLRPGASLHRVSDLPGSPVAAALDDLSASDLSYFGPISCARRALSAYLHTRRRYCRPPHLRGGLGRRRLDREKVVMIREHLRKGKPLGRLRRARTVSDTRARPGRPAARSFSDPRLVRGRCGPDLRHRHRGLVVHRPDHGPPTHRCGPGRRSTGRCGPVAVSGARDGAGQCVVLLVGGVTGMIGESVIAIAAAVQVGYLLGALVAAQRVSVST